MPSDKKEKSLPRKVISRTSRAGIGGGAVLIGIALYLLMRGPGLGGPGSAGTESESGADEKTMITSSPESSPTSVTKPVAAADPIEGGLTEDEEKALSGDIFTVLIDEHNFLIEVPGTGEPVFRLTPLDRVVELAGLAKGDTNGVKVKVLRRESSRASAEFQLKSELERRGIRSDAIIMPSEFVP